MPVISLLNQKGGVGKTTLAISIAMCLAEQGRNVLLIDADQQGSALDWKAARGDLQAFPVVGLPRDTIHREYRADTRPAEPLRRLGGERHR